MFGSYIKITHKRGVIRNMSVFDMGKAFMNAIGSHPIMERVVCAAIATLIDAGELKKENVSMLKNSLNAQE